MNKIRTRFAPSPTGRMHVGNLRTALYEYLIAKHEGGTFVLRIEDTDQQREVEGAVDIIYRTLKDTGLIHDEGPDKEANYGPYVQSERQEKGIYIEYAKQLIESGDAYYCFCSKERLDTLRSHVGNVEEADSEKDFKEITKYDKHCMKLSKEEVNKYLNEGIPYTIRQNNPTEGSTTFKDEVFGEISVDNSELDDMILIKSDGFPTYNFANVVDDHLMKITHVVRGNEYLSSTPKYTRLYEAFGWEEPVYVHCPLITNEEHKKLSKRSGHSSYEDLIEQGFVSEAIINFIALLGWSPSNNQEIMSLDELIELFDYKNINKAPAVFDMVKLRWMNGEYIKKMDEQRYIEMAMPQIKEIITKDIDLKKIAMLVKTRIETFIDIKEMIDFFEEMPQYDISIFTHKKMKTNSENSLEVLEDLLPKFVELQDYNESNIEKVIKDYIGEKGIKNGQGLWPIRTAVSGKQNTPGGAYEIMTIIGKEESVNRIKRSIKMLKNSI
ncbi:MAG TPA: glutamate--tRNA ligase [Clostridiales bacterium]|nr:glutamate--tRNA ligase [Clostridiales bacterium]